MPLLDHFHPPLLDRAPWSSICTMWIANLVKDLNRTLPRDRFRAFANAHLSSTVEADIAEYDRGGDQSNSDDAAVALEQPALFTIEAQFPDEFEVQIHEYRDGMRLSAVIELISPGNKDREVERRKFISKCSSYLAMGIGVILVDVVTNRRFNLHNLLMEELGTPSANLSLEPPCYVAAYRPNPWNTSHIDVWPFAASIGAPIPSVPLPLREGPSILVDLEATYSAALDDHGIDFDHTITAS